MIDRGISENYVILWLEDDADAPVERLEQCLNAARTVARHGAGGQSLIELYDRALAYFGGNQTLAAEFLRRALHELAAQTPVDDGLPPPDSWQWEHIRSMSCFPIASTERPRPPPRLARPPGSSR
jgi:hypothetical protein